VFQSRAKNLSACGIDWPGRRPLPMVDVPVDHGFVDRRGLDPGGGAVPQDGQQSVPGAGIAQLLGQLFPGRRLRRTMLPLTFLLRSPEQGGLAES
jgi:hypothetical protein